MSPAPTNFPFFSYFAPFVMYAACAARAALLLLALAGPGSAFAPGLPVVTVRARSSSRAAAECASPRIAASRHRAQLKAAQSGRLWTSEEHPARDGESAAVSSLVRRKLVGTAAARYSPVPFERRVITFNSCPS
jgi:hypothetical protein